MQRLVLIALAGLALVGCSPPPQEPASAPATNPAPSPSVSEPRWAFGVGKNSVEMAWVTDAATAEAPLSLVCARGDGIMVVARAFKPIGSEERLSIGAGSDAFALVAVAAEDPHGPFVRATGAAEPGLLAALESGQPISASYGAQRYGPITTPPPALARAFADTCRKLNGGEEGHQV